MHININAYAKATENNFQGQSTGRNSCAIIDIYSRLSCLFFPICLETVINIFD